jgi:hypothetical protein
MKPIRLFTTALAGFALATGLPAQTLPTTVKKDTTVPDAVVLFKAGNAATAVAAIQAKVRTGPNVSHPDLQVARQLAAVTATLRSGGDDAHAREAATLALAKLAQPEAKMTTKDAAAAEMLAGGLHEQSNDLANAKLAYQRALALDPKLRQATDRLAHIAAQEQRAAAKPAANAVLKQRAAPLPTVKPAAKS